MDGKKLITICQFGGKFVPDEDGSLSYNGGEAHAIDINHETPLEEFKSEIAELLNCTSGSVSIKYFLPGNRETLINISNDKDLKRMISFHADSVMVDVFATSGEIVANDVSNMPASRSSRTTLSSPLALPSPKLDKVPSSWKHALTGVHQRFYNAQEFRDALQKYAIAHAFAYTFKKNDRHRVTVKCKAEGCSFWIHASRLLTTQFFVIKKMDPHTCKGGVLDSGSRAATNWVASIVKDKLRDSPNYKPKDIINDIKEECGIELNYYQAFRRKDIAREELRGSYKEAYTHLPFLCEKIIDTNPGSLANLTSKDDTSFHRLFISFHASIQGFQLGCRPLLFLDSLPLKSKYLETILVATAADGVDGAFPVAFAIIDDETVDNWRWFLMELKSAISTSRRITFVADMLKGLRESIPEIFEDSIHGYCIKHLSESFRKDLPVHFSNEVRRLLVADFKDAAYALKLEEFQRITESIKSISPESFSWIMNNKPEQWANAYFQGSRYNHLTSNFGELFYNWVTEAQELPITHKVHMIQGKMMELIYTRNLDSSQWLTRLTPPMEEKLQNEILKEDSQNLEVLCSPGTENVYEVHGDDVETVDLDKLGCSCKEWQLTGLPCCHAIAVIKYIGRSPYDYCDTYLTTESCRLTYSESINPVPEVDDKPIETESSQLALVITPPTGCPPTRPKRKRDALKGKKRNQKCSKCKVAGHNVSNCKYVP